MKARFQPGRIVATKGVYNLINQNPRFSAFVNRSLNRHIQGNWGNLCEEDKKANESSLKDGLRLLSSYKEKDLPQIWIITEADRSATTILFPEEY